MKYQLCPKCNGQGYVSKPPYVAEDQNTWTSSATSFVCDVCSGTKILLVQDDNSEIIVLAESSLKKDWNSPEENETWKDL